MAIVKSFGNTFLFLVVLNLVSCWILIDIPLEFETLLYLDEFCTPFLCLLMVGIYLGLVKESEFLAVSETSMKYYILGFFLGITFVFVQSPLNLIYNDLFGTKHFIKYSFEPSQLLRWGVLGSVLMVPVYEEFFFRKFIQRDFQKSFHPVLAILFASMLFACIHLPFHSLFFDKYLFSFHHAYITFFGGLISGILFYKSESVGPSIVMHFFWNLCVYVF